MVSGFAVGIVVLKITTLVKCLSMRLMFTVTEQAGERALGNWYVCDINGK